MARDVNGNDGRFIGTKISEELHRRIKIRLAERGMSMRDALIEGLLLVLNLEEEKDEEETKRAVAQQ